MKSIVIASALLLLLQGHLFCQGRYLVTNTLISQYDSVANTWTEPKPARLFDDYDATVSFYKDSIYYAVKERKKKRAKSPVGWKYTLSPYTIAMALLQREIPGEDSMCYSDYKASIVEDGKRLDNDHLVLVNNNKAPAEIRLVSCYDISNFKNATIKTGSLRITINQAPLRDKPFSKWRLLLEVSRLPQTK